MKKFPIALLNEIVICEHCGSLFIGVGSAKEIHLNWHIALATIGAGNGS